MLKNWKHELIDKTKVWTTIRVVIDQNGFIWYILDNAEFKEQLEINRYDKLVNVLDAMYATLSAPSS